MESVTSGRGRKGGERLGSSKIREVPSEVRKAGALWRPSRILKVTEEDTEAVSLSVVFRPPASESNGERCYKGNLTSPINRDSDSLYLM